jgi:putative chitinase
MLSLSQLVACMPGSEARAPVFVECLNTAMTEFAIDSLARQACFLAQVAHESGSLRYTLELASGRDYEGREDVGNTQPGDGPKYKGRGLLQVTGRANTEACLLKLRRNIEDRAYLETPMGASRSAAWFWDHKGLNAPADQGLFWTISKKINGGTNGLDDRIRHYVRIRKVLGI